MNERYGRDYFDDDDEGREDWSDRSERTQRARRDFSPSERERGNWGAARGMQGSNQSSERNWGNYGQGRSQSDQDARYGQDRYGRGDYSGEFGGSGAGADRRYSGGSYSRDRSSAGFSRGQEGAYGRGGESGENQRYDRPWDSNRWGGTGDRFGRGEDFGRSNDSSLRGGYIGRYGQDSGSMSQGGGFFGKGPKDYVRSDDRIREDVCDRLSIDDEIDASDITVRVKDGEVTLEGTVPDRRSKHRAEDLVESVSGVKDIHNSLKPQKGLLQEMGDRVTGRAEAEQHGHSGLGPRNGTSASRH